MLDPIVAFFTRVFQAIGHGIGLVVSWICWPFIAVSRWYAHRGWIIKGPIGIALLVLVGLYAYLVWNTQRWTGFDPDYVGAYGRIYWIYEKKVVRVPGCDRCADPEVQTVPICTEAHYCTKCTDLLTKWDLYHDTIDRNRPVPEI